jgi:hypothetical protein
MCDKYPQRPNRNVSKASDVSSKLFLTYPTIRYTIWFWLFTFLRLLGSVARSFLLTLISISKSFLQILHFFWFVSSFLFQFYLQSLGVLTISFMCNLLCFLFILLTHISVHKFFLHLCFISSLKTSFDVSNNFEVFSCKSFIVENSL